MIQRSNKLDDVANHSQVPRRSRFRIRNVVTIIALLGGLVIGYRFYVGETEEAPVGELIHIQTASEVASELATITSDAVEEMPDELGGPASDAFAVDSITSIISTELVQQAEHPLDPVLEVACWSISQIDQDIKDYSATVTTQVFIDGRLGKERQMEALVRHARKEGEVDVPFSVYLNFLAPRNVKGQEVLWVDGLNDGKMLAHGTGLFKYKLMKLDPTGPLAMRGSRYPITDIGFRSLIAKMHEIGCCDREHDDCQVLVSEGVKVEDRSCMLLEIIHEQEDDCFQFHHAKIYVDIERKIPIGYEGYGWPASKDEKPPLLEKFYYTNIKLNPGLTDADFNPKNRKYQFPGW